MVNKLERQRKNQRIEEVINNPDFITAVNNLDFNELYKDIKSAEGAFNLKAYWKQLVGLKSTQKAKEVKKFIKEIKGQTRQAIYMCVLAHDITKNIDTAGAAELKEMLEPNEKINFFENPIVRGYALHLLGKVYVELENFEEAIKAFEEITPNMGQKYHKATLELSNLYYDNNNFDKALALNESVMNGERKYLCTNEQIEEEINKVFQHVTADSGANFADLPRDNINTENGPAFLHLLIKLAKELNKPNRKKLSPGEIQQIKDFNFG